MELESDLALRASQIKHRPCTDNTCTWALISFDGVNRFSSSTRKVKSSVLSMHAMQRPVYLQPIQPGRGNRPAGKAWGGKPPESGSTRRPRSAACNMHHVRTRLQFSRSIDCPIKTRARYLRALCVVTKISRCEN